MGIVKAILKISNPVIPSLKTMNLEVLVDSGATFLCIPEHIATQLQLIELEKREVILADGSIKLVPYVGPVKISFDNRSCFAGAMVLDDQSLLGVIPMEDMDLVIHPRNFKLSVNPANPNIATGLAKTQLCLI